jgi:glutamyl-tRNA synthetase
VGDKSDPALSAEVASQAYQILAELPDMSRETAEPEMRALADDLGLKAGQVFSILRVAVTGRTVSPPLFESMAVIGKETVLRRVKNAIEILEKMESPE